jgi:hypothetical protein
MKDGNEAAVLSTYDRIAAPHITQRQQGPDDRKLKQRPEFRDLSHGLTIA